MATIYIPQQPSKRNNLPLDAKVEILARCKLRGADPRVVVKEIYEEYGRAVPAHPGQCLSGFATLLKGLIEDNDSEAIALARRFGFEIDETPAGN